MNQQLIIEGLINNLNSAIDACNIGIAFDHEKYTALKAGFEAQITKLKEAKPMPADDFISMVGSINSELQKLK